MALIKRFSQGAFLNLAKLVCGLIKVKLIAVVLGVAGVGVFSLAAQFQLTLTYIISMGISLGVINLSRPLVLAKRTNEAAGIAGTSLGMILGNAVLTAAVVAVGAPLIGNEIFANHLPNFLLLPLLSAAIVAAIITGLFEALFFSVDRFDRYVTAASISAVVDLIAIATGAMLFGLVGAILGLALSNLIMLCIYVILAWNTLAIRPILKNLRWKQEATRPLLQYSVMMLSTTTLTAVCLMLSRSSVVQSSGTVANGLLQVPTALSAYLLPVITNGLHGYLIPLTSGEGDSPGARKELERAMLLSIAIAATGCIAIVLLSPVLIPLIYTPAFGKAQPLVDLYFAADFLFLVANAYGVYLMGIGAKRAFIVGNLLYGPTLLAVVVIYSTNLGPWAFVAGHIIAAAIVAIAMTIWALRVGHLRPISLCVFWMVGLGTSAVGLLALGQPSGVAAPLSWIIGTGILTIGIALSWRATRPLPS